jgi:hypothetical protein
LLWWLSVRLIAGAIFIRRSTLLTTSRRLASVTAVRLASVCIGLLRARATGTWLGTWLGTIECEDIAWFRILDLVLQLGKRRWWTTAKLPLRRPGGW